MSNISYLIGAHGIAVYVDRKSYTIPNQSKNYDLVLRAIKNDDLDALREALDIRTSIVSALANTGGNVVRVDGSRIMYGDYEITGLVYTRIFEMMNLGVDVKPMIRFCENLMKNPSNRAVNELFGFLDACSLPITEDGHFLTYKRIRTDYKDVHSGTFDNSVGKIVEVPRNQVDEDSNRTCSYGLHVCSYDYLAHFSGERIVVCKVSPENVVSVPSDYNNSKMRVCKYEVVDEIPLSDFTPTTKIKDWYTDDYSDDWAVEDEEGDDDEEDDDWFDDNSDDWVVKDEEGDDDEEDDWFDSEDEIFIDDSDEGEEFDQPESALTPLEIIMEQLEEDEFENLQVDLQRIRSGGTELTLSDVARWYEVDENDLQNYYDSITSDGSVDMPRYEVIKYNDICGTWVHHSDCHTRSEARTDKWKLQNNVVAAYIYDRQSGTKVT